MKLMGKQAVGDGPIIIGLIAIFNVYHLFLFDSFEHLNARKAIFILLAGFFYFLEMYFIVWLAYRKMKSTALFFALSLFVWLLQPLLLAQVASNGLDAWQGENQIFEDGQLTLYGYLDWLQSPFLLLAIYALIMLVIDIYRQLNAWGWSCERQDI